MKLLCSRTGIQFNADYCGFLSLESPTVTHPIFQVPQKKLISFAKKWSDGELSEIDSFLIFVAILNSSERVVWRTPIKYSPMISSRVANNFDRLVMAVSNINSIANPHVVFPLFAITQETNELQNIGDWITTWNKTFEDFNSGYVTISHDVKVARRAQAIEYLLHSPYRSSPQKLANAIAEWAALAGNFPHSITQDEDGNNVPLDEYWKGIIRRCAREESIFSIRDVDIEELRDHCHENIPAGSVHSYNLYKLLEQGQKRKNNYLGFNLIDLPDTPFRILSEEDTIEKANIQILIDTAPTSEPRPEQYPTKLAFLKAQMAWSTAQVSLRNRTTASLASINKSEGKE